LNILLVSVGNLLISMNVKKVGINKLVDKE